MMASTMTWRWLTASALLFCLCVFGAQAQEQNVGQVLKANNATTFYDLFVKAGLTDILEGTTFHTVFAPSDEALKGYKAPSGAELVHLLQYHVTAKPVLAADLTTGLTFPSLLQVNGTYSAGKSFFQRLLVNKANATGAFLLAGDDTTTAIFSSSQPSLSKVNASVAASNGQVHVVDRLLTIPSKGIYDTLNLNDNAKNFSSAAQMIKNAKLDTQFTTNTTALFAPTNAAFSALPRAWSGYFLVPAGSDAAKTVLSNHYTKDQELVFIGETTTGTSNLTMENGVSVTLTVEKDSNTLSANFSGTPILALDVRTSSGVIQAVDQVIIPSNVSLDLVQLMQGYNTTTFLYHLNTSGLLPNANNTWHTIFAPTDAAFSEVSYTLRHSNTAERLSYFMSHLTVTYNPTLENNTMIPVASNKFVVVSKDQEGNTYLYVNGSNIRAKVLSQSLTLNLDVKGIVYELDHVLDVRVTGPPLTKQQIGWIVVGGIGFIVVLCSAIFIGVHLYKKHKARSLSGYTQINDGLVV